MLILVYFFVSILLSSLHFPSCYCSAASAGSFPSGFHFGAATAAFQIEGAFQRDGRGLAEWDVIDHFPGRVTNNDNADVADGSYDLWRRDLELLVALNVSSYRFSISWSRIIDSTGQVNPKGVAHYSELIDALLVANIEPFVTLYHGDLPFAYSTYFSISHGFLNSSYFVPLWLNYADAIFTNFGSRVNHWITFNEPQQICIPYFSTDSLRGNYNLSTAAYQCALTILLAHAETVKLYRSKFSSLPAAEFGMTLDGDFAIPNSQSEADLDACERHLLFELGWFADVLYFGDWPKVMKERLPAGTMPEISAAQRELFLSTIPDFFGHNHYTSHVFRNDPNSTTGAGVIGSDFYADGTPVGPLAASNWLRVVPFGIRAMLNWQHNRYGASKYYIFENGCDVPDESSIPFPEVLNDQFRVSYLTQYLGNLSLAIADGVPVHGYYVWSLLDNFEWNSGYAMRFGIHYVNYKTLERTQKQSAIWYSNFIKKQREINNNNKQNQIIVDEQRV